MTKTEIAEIVALETLVFERKNNGRRGRDISTLTINEHMQALKDVGRIPTFCSPKTVRREIKRLAELTRDW